MNLSSYPSIAGALAEELHGRFLAEAENRRRLAQVHQVWRLDTVAARLIRAVRANGMTGSAWMESWGAATSPLSMSRRFVKGEGWRDATARTG